METLLEKSYKILDNLRLPHGLYLASPSSHYSYVWIRDSVYMSLPYVDKDNGIYEKTYHRLLDLFREYEWKLDIHVAKKPIHLWEYLHSRYSSEDVKEIHNQEWGHSQHDAIGAFLYGVGFGESRGRRIIRDKKDKDIIRKLVYYLNTLEYWQDPDNGMWEEAREVHASSIGACLAGMIMASYIIDVSADTIAKGVRALQALFPHESASKYVDLAQLSLVYPYNLFAADQAKVIVQNVEGSLLRERGVIRYEGDSYYSAKEESFGRSRRLEFYYDSEAEWCFGLPWLALCHMDLGNIEVAKKYIDMTEEVALEDGSIPELYFAKTKDHNPNTPLGWANAMYILAKERYDRLTK